MQWSKSIIGKNVEFGGKFRAMAKSFLQPNSATTHSVKAKTFPTLSFLVVKTSDVQVVRKLI